MEPTEPLLPQADRPPGSLTIRVVGVGGAGGNIVEALSGSALPGVEFLVVNTDAQALGRIQTVSRFTLGERSTRGLGAGGDPEVGRAAAEEDQAALRQVCQGADLVCVVAGMGGGTGTGAAPVLARIAAETGALVLGVVTMPFQCEGARRQRQAVEGLERLRASADALICLPNQRVLRTIDENTSLIDTFKITNDFVLQGIKGIWRMLTQVGLINVDFADLCSVLRGRHANSAFASVEARGETRVHDVLERLQTSPFLDQGQALTEADAVLVSLAGGPSLTMGEVNRVMEAISRNAERAQVIMGATIDPGLADQLTVTVIAAGCRNESPVLPIPAPPVQTELGGGGTRAGGEDPGFETALFTRAEVERATGRFAPPPPELSAAQREELIARETTGPRKARKAMARLRQGLLALEVVSKGRFEKSEPTIHRGEDLDVPTYVRRGLALN